jgi:hypothetical protein
VVLAGVVILGSAGWWLVEKLRHQS